MKKKILMVRSNPYDFNPNSYNVQEVGLGKAFCHLGYDYDYITFKKHDQKEWIFYEENGHIARWIEKPRLRVLRMGINRDIWSKEFLSNYDIVICREYYQFETYMITQRHNNVAIYNGPYWNMFMLKPFSAIYDFLFTKKINEAVKCIFTKSDLSSTFLEKKGYTKLKTIGVALDTSRFQNCHISEETMKIVDYMKSNRCILYVGTIDENKNYSFLLKVYASLVQDYPDLKMVVIGKSKQSGIKKLFKKDDSYERECYKEIPEELRKSIFRVEKIENSQMKYIYPLAKAFLLPSKKEIFGMVLLEAMYLGAPVITSENGGSVTLIHNNDTGIVIKEFDVQQWKEAVSRYLQDDEFRNKTILRAHNLIEDKYNWEYLANQIVETIDKDNEVRK